jgi:hypothetical protein
MGGETDTMPVLLAKDLTQRDERLNITTRTNDMDDNVHSWWGESSEVFDHVTRERFDGSLGTFLLGSHVGM